MNTTARPLVTPNFNLKCSPDPNNCVGSIGQILWRGFRLINAPVRVRWAFLIGLWLRDPCCKNRLLFHKSAGCRWLTKPQIVHQMCLCFHNLFQQFHAPSARKRITISECVNAWKRFWASLIFRSPYQNALWKGKIEETLSKGDDFIAPAAPFLEIWSKTPPNQNA